MQLRNGFKPLARGPGLDVRPAVVRRQHADRHVKLGIELQREIVRHGRKAVRALPLPLSALDVLPVQLLPRCAARAHRLRLPCGAVAGEADVRPAHILGDHGPLFVPMARIHPDKRNAHVRLAAGEPHLPHEHILHLHAVHLQGAAFLRRRERTETRPPFALRIRPCLGRPPGERHLDGFARIGRAPDGNRPFTLKHHVVGERHAKPDGRTRLKESGPCDRQKQMESFHFPFCPSI